MSNIQSFQMFLKEPRPKESTLAVLCSMLDFGVESEDIKIKGAAGVAQVQDHRQGYAQSWLISWPCKFKASVSYRGLAQRVAKSLDVLVLLEPDNANEKWLVFSPDGKVQEVEVEYLDDGIDIVMHR